MGLSIYTCRIPTAKAGAISGTLGGASFVSHWPKKGVRGTKRALQSSGPSSSSSTEASTGGMADARFTNICGNLSPKFTWDACTVVVTRFEALDRWPFPRAALWPFAWGAGVPFSRALATPACERGAPLLALLPPLQPSLG